jgi:hypothetical protein
MEGRSDMCCSLTSMDFKNFIHPETKENLIMRHKAPCQPNLAGAARFATVPTDAILETRAYPGMQLAGGTILERESARLVRRKIIGTEHCAGSAVPGTHVDNRSSTDMCSRGSSSVIYGPGIVGERSVCTPPFLLGRNNCES